MNDPTPLPPYRSLAEAGDARYALISIVDGALVPAAVDVIDTSIDRDPDAFPELTFLLTPRGEGKTAYTERAEPAHSRDVRIRRALAEQLVDRLLADPELVIYPVDPPADDDAPAATLLLPPGVNPPAPGTALYVLAEDWDRMLEHVNERLLRQAAPVILSAAINGSQIVGLEMVPRPVAPATTQVSR